MDDQKNLTSYLSDYYYYYYYSSFDRIYFDFKYHTKKREEEER